MDSWSCVRNLTLARGARLIRINSRKLDISVSCPALISALKAKKKLQTNTEHFKPLIKTKCNRNIQFFVCSVFAPMCPEGMPQAVTSCRSVCEQVRPIFSFMLIPFLC
ncbi:hypothetical protein ANCCAN_27587 [Ancylostoma caninum]|uniref:FZ domain-containing protein n=1 Tax=Ancylostoma caninum TaxID=29170 RepID=A0A368F3L4_ANCCA|nr:hypothetical protein ANCCAN_27587 [Ancylostoma caninum]